MSEYTVTVKETQTRYQLFITFAEPYRVGDKFANLGAKNRLEAFMRLHGARGLNYGRCTRIDAHTFRMVATK